ncbi:aldehyde dehydrogenase family protein, partial [Klebsiella pneumoniae]|uniref:aldehyde dehydrogenase family protein n=1 Tax=Klebsiella pneumoniae TaxID=573 RepID=UPI00396F49A1
DKDILPRAIALHDLTVVPVRPFWLIVGIDRGERNLHSRQLLDVRQEMDIIHEETFGPVLPVVAFSTLDEALAMANDSDYGLTSSIYTRDLNVAMKAIKGLKFGETYINRENFEAMQGFHAGWRKSGIGGADGRHGLNEYLQTQVVYLQA